MVNGGWIEKKISGAYLVDTLSHYVRRKIKGIFLKTENEKRILGKLKTKILNLYFQFQKIRKIEDPFFEVRSENARFPEGLLNFLFSFFYLSVWKFVFFQKELQFTIL